MPWHDAKSEPRRRFDYLSQSNDSATEEHNWRCLFPLSSTESHGRSRVWHIACNPASLYDADHRRCHRRSKRTTGLAVREIFVGSLDITRISLCFSRSDIVDIKPPNMEDLTEVITGAEFHPRECNIFVYSSSRGIIRLCDMRQSALCDRHCKGKPARRRHALRHSPCLS